MKTKYVLTTQNRDILNETNKLTIEDLEEKDLYNALSNLFGEEYEESEKDINFFDFCIKCLESWNDDGENIYHLFMVEDTKYIEIHPTHIERLKW